MRGDELPRLSGGGVAAIPLNTAGSARAAQSDEALALAARQDRSAFLALHGRYIDRIERYVLARASNPSDVEDLVSIIFMRALEHIRQFQPQRGSFAGWLFTIARNAVSDHYRAGRRLFPGVFQRESDVAPSAEEATLRSEHLGSLGQAVKQLTRDQRDALALRYVAGLPFTEIGRAMGKSDDAAQKLVHRGIEALRREMQQEVQS